MGWGEAGMHLAAGKIDSIRDGHGTAQSSRLDAMVVHSPGCSLLPREGSPVSLWGLSWQAIPANLQTVGPIQTRGQQTATKAGSHLSDVPHRLELSWQNICSSWESPTSSPAPCYGWSPSTKTSCASYREHRPLVPVASGRFHQYPFTARLSNLV